MAAGDLAIPAFNGRSVVSNVGNSADCHTEKVLFIGIRASRDSGRLNLGWLSQVNAFTMQQIQTV
jgi:hypothetical protein